MYDSMTYKATYVNCVGVLCVRMYDSMTYKATYVNCVGVLCVMIQ